MTGASALVWFKRGLRVRDHAPLAEAMHFESALALVVIEPQWLGSPECDPRHVGFLLDCVAELQNDLAARGLPLTVRTGAMPQVLQDLRHEFAFSQILSHEETGPGWSYTRDLAVADWCSGQGVQWVELPQAGVVRRLRSRDGWAARWAQRMNAPEAPPARGFKAAAGRTTSPLPTLRAALPLGGQRTALAAEKEKLYHLRQTREAHAEANAIQHKHGSRKSGLSPTAATKRRSSAVPRGQGQLFWSRIQPSTMASSA